MELGGRGMAELVTMGDDDAEAVELDGRHLRQLAAQLQPIRVAVHRGERGQRLQIDQDVPGPHVPAVQDVVHLLEHLEDLRAQHSVRIRNDTESHSSPAFSPSPAPAPAPPRDQRDLDVKVIEDPLHHEVHEIAHLLGLVIEARGGGEHDRTRLRDEGEVAQVDERQRRFARHEDQPAALLQHHVGTWCIASTSSSRTPYGAPEAPVMARMTGSRPTTARAGSAWESVEGAPVDGAAQVNAECGMRNAEWQWKVACQPVLGDAPAIDLS